MTQKIAFYMLQRIKVYNQFNSNFCTMFAVGHALAVMLRARYKDVEVSPWQIVRLTFLHGGFKRILNWGRSYEEVMTALKHYGLWVKVDGEKRKLFPGALIPIKPQKFHQYLGKYPVLASTTYAHAVVVIGLYPDNPAEYVVIDSQSGKKYNHIYQRYFEKFYLILNYTFDER